MSEEFRRQVKGQIIRAADLNKVSRSVSRLNRPLTPGGGLNSFDNTCGLGVSQFDPDRPVWIQITGGGNPYSWQALIKVSGGWVTHSESQWGEVGDQYAASGFPAYEVNGGEGVHSGSIHRAWLAEEGDHLVFKDCCGEIPLVISPPEDYSSGPIFVIDNPELPPVTGGVGDPLFAVYPYGAEITPPVNQWPYPALGINLSSGYTSNPVEMGYSGQELFYSISPGGTQVIKPVLPTDGGIVIDLVQGYTATPFGIYDFMGNPLYAINQSGLITTPSVTSESIASGSITSDKIASGLMVPRVGYRGLPAGETLAGLSAVRLSGNALVLCHVSGTGDGLPSLGVVHGSYNSGATVDEVVTKGRISVNSGLDVSWSGVDNVSLFVGSGGRVITSGQFDAGGQLYQRLGTAVSGGMFVDVVQHVIAGAANLLGR